MDTDKKEGKIILNAEELAGVSGGAGRGRGDANMTSPENALNPQGNPVAPDPANTGLGTRELFCSDPRCNQPRIFYLGTGGRATCSFCHSQIFI